ncbi:hypothetical protein BH11PLA2_BH11PLA2_08050 [soil metagenome]
MARKRPTSPKTVAVKLSTLAEIDAFLLRDDLYSAFNAIALQHANQPTPATLLLFRRVLAAYQQETINRNDLVNYDKVNPIGDTLDSNDPAWMLVRANLLAKAGRLPQALMMLPADADSKARDLLVAHVADRAVRFKTYGGLPEEHHEGLKAITLAFAKYEKGDDEAARKVLNEIGLQSPFLEWKLLLRGLMAYDASDNARALENWQRLHPDRIPARLAGPLRASLDKQFLNVQPALLQSRWQQAATSLQSTKLTADLMAVQRSFAQDGPLKNGWPQAERAWANLNPSMPDLAERFVDVVYHTIIRQGEPADVERFRRSFGVPSDDPDFSRLHAMVFEAVGDLPASMTMWEKYERWLSTKPPRWSETMLPRARAMVLTHLGNMAAINDAKAATPDFLRDAIEEMLGGVKKKKTGSTNPVPYFESAAALDPTAVPPLMSLAKYHLVKNALPEAELAVKRALEREPGKQSLLEDLAFILRDQYRLDESFDVWLQARAGNPLDKDVVLNTSLVGLATVRRAAFEGRDTEADELLREHHGLFQEQQSIQLLSLHWLLACKKRDKKLAEEFREALLATPGNRLAVLFIMSIDATLAKLKPAEKTAANKALIEAMKLPTTPMELYKLDAAFEGYGVFGFEFRGQKSFRTKIHKLCETTLTVNAPLIDFEKMLLAIDDGRNWKLLLKAAITLGHRYHDNPAFAVFEAIGLANTNGGWGIPQRIRRILDSVGNKLDGRTDKVGEYLRECLPRLEAEARDFDPFSFMNQRR